MTFPTTTSRHPGPLATHFAPARRVGPEELANQIRAVTGHPVIDALMGTVGGLFAVLNDKRQVLSLNHGLLQMLGVADPGAVLGLRVGEAVQCVHAHDMPGGCGTSEYCATCGQAIAQVTSLMENRPVERKCSVAARRGNAEVNLCLSVRACPFECDGLRVLLVFLQDETRHQQVAALEQVFFHDLRNTLTGLLGSSELLCLSIPEDGELGELAGDVLKLARRVAREVDLQRWLVQASGEGFEARRETWQAGDILQELRAMCANHPAAAGRQIHHGGVPPGLSFATDPTVLLRVLYNMVINALEATPPGGVIRVWVEGLADGIAFCVWNAAAIPPAQALRIFQAHFSTHDTPGRGLGTHSMKLLGERVLGGSVTFTSTPGEGTCFRIRLPWETKGPTAGS